MTRTTNTVSDPTLLAAALEGLELQKQRIDDQIRQVKAMLGVRTPRAVTAAPAAPASEKPARKRRVLSAAARKRIALAQKKRWAEFHKKQAAGG